MKLYEHIKFELEKIKLSDVDEQTGVEIVKKSLKSPLFFLASNAGMEGAIVVEKVLSDKGNKGMNIQTGNYEDLMKAGIIDPTKVTRFAIQNAASISGLLLTTEALITDVPEKKEPSMPHPGMGGGMDGMGM